MSETGPDHQIVLHNGEAMTRRVTYTMGPDGETETVGPWRKIEAAPLVTDEIVNHAARVHAERRGGHIGMRAALAAVAADLDRAGYDRARRECAEELRALMLSPDSWLTVDGCDSLSTVALDGLADRWSSSGRAPAGEEEQ